MAGFQSSGIEAVGLVLADHQSFLQQNRSNSSSLRPVMARQIRPLPWVAIPVVVAGVIMAVPFSFSFPQN